MRSAPSPTASADAASSAFTFSGPVGEGRDDRNAPGRERIEDCLRPARDRRADVPELRHVRRFEADLVAGEPERARADRPAQLAVDREQRLTDDRERSFVGDAAAADEARAQPGGRHRRSDLRPAAVDDDRVVEVA